MERNRSLKHLTASRLQQSVGAPEVSLAKNYSALSAAYG